MRTSEIYLDTAQCEIKTKQRTENKLVAGQLSHSHFCIDRLLRGAGSPLILSLHSIGTFDVSTRIVRLPAPSPHHTAARYRYQGRRQ